MMKLIFKVFVCIILLFAAITLAACSNEAEALQERIDTLEGEKTELQSTVSSLQADLESTRASLSSTHNELQIALSALQDAIAAAQQNNPEEPLAITYGGSPNKDMSWPFSYGDLPLGLRINLNLFNEGEEITWRSADEDIFIVVPSEDGTSATVTPQTVGSAQIIVTVGDQETRSWVRIT